MEAFKTWVNNHKKLAYGGVAVIVVLLLAGMCGGGSNSSSNDFPEKRINPQTTQVRGPLGKAYTVTNRGYKLLKEYSSYYINVELTLTDEDGLPDGYDPMETDYFGNKSKGTKYLGGFGIEYLDEDGEVIEQHNATNAYSWDAVKAALSLSEGESATVRFKLEHPKSAVAFRITSAYEPNPSVKSGNADSDGKKEDSILDDDDLEELGDDLDKSLEQLGKVFDMVGTMVDVAKDVNELNNKLLK